MLQAPGRSVPEARHSVKQLGARALPSAKTGTEPVEAKVTAEPPPPKSACYTSPTGLHQGLASTDKQPDQRL